jgi:demethylmenaquinone methyltransferase / 2-methoxy-6-polyprenyl-1,4-benzoquinol methylase
VARHDSAYAYLPQSVLAFPAPDALAALMADAGFERVNWEPRSGGIVAIHAGERPAA